MGEASTMKVVILAGGLGTRLSEETSARPKPMVEVGGRPILWHLLKSYSHYGFREFAVALGYKGETVKDYFLGFHHRGADLTIDLSNGHVDVHGQTDEDWIVHLVDTGATTQTGGRLQRLAPLLAGGGTFLMTYGDGLGNVPIDELVAFHRSHGKLATVTAVRPPAKFGALDVEGDRVVSFTEKPPGGEGWVSGGFFVLEPEVLDFITTGDDSEWERGPLEAIAASGELVAYRHRGFWQSMDTLRDLRTLQSLWENGPAPWQVWR